MAGEVLGESFFSCKNPGFVYFCTVTVLFLPFPFACPNWIN